MPCHIRGVLCSRFRDMWNLLIIELQLAGDKNQITVGRFGPRRIEHSKDVSHYAVLANW